MDLFRDRILENEHRTKEGQQKSLSNLKHNLAKNSLEVRKLQLIWTDFSPRGICKITSRTIHIKLREDMPSNVPVAPALPLFRMVNRSRKDLIYSDNIYCMFIEFGFKPGGFVRGIQFLAGFFDQIRNVLLRLPDGHSARGECPPISPKRSSSTS